MAACTAATPEISQGSCLQDLLTFITCYAKVECELDASELTARGALGLQRELWGAALKQAGYDDLCKTIGTVFNVPAVQRPKLLKGLEMLGLEMRSVADEVKKKNTPSPIQKKPKKARTGSRPAAGRASGERPSSAAA